MGTYKQTEYFYLHFIFVIYFDFENI